MITLDDLRAAFLALPYATEDLPFGPEHLVFKVGGKMFGIIGLDHSELRCTVKCDPDRAEELRMHYNAVEPGYHTNKKHWNTIYCNGDLDRKGVIAEIEHSYRLVYDSLPKHIKADLQDEV